MQAEQVVDTVADLEVVPAQLLVLLARLIQVAAAAVAVQQYQLLRVVRVS